MFFGIQQKQSGFISDICLIFNQGKCTPYDFETHCQRLSIHKKKSMPLFYVITYLNCIDNLRFAFY